MRCPNPQQKFCMGAITAVVCVSSTNEASVNDVCELMPSNLRMR